MNTFKMKSSFLGTHFKDVAKEAKEMAKKKKCLVEFEFNEVVCIVSEDTYLDGLWEYYGDAHIMDWKTVGPECLGYDIDTQIELYTRRLTRAKERKIAMEESDKKDAAQKKGLEAAVAGIELLIIEDKKDQYASYVETNSKDGYSKAVIDYADGWGKMMQKMMGDNKTVSQVADDAQELLGYLGITGFQYGCAVKVLTNFWVHGEELRKWHNKSYGHEGEGVVNPAVLTVKTA